MKDILVTGAYGGMGTATVRLLRDKGYRVFALDLRCDEAEEGIIPIEFDITSEESVTEAYQKVASYTDNLFAVIHFAGMYSLDSLVEMETSSFRKIFDVNFYGPLLVNKMFVPLLSKGSRIVITTSELAPLAPLPFFCTAEVFFDLLTAPVFLLFSQI